MIVLDTLDTLHNTAKLGRRDRGSVSPEQRRDFESRLAAVGLSVVFDEDELAGDSRALEHSWREEEGRLVYEVRVPHAWESAAALGTYLVVALATLDEVPASTRRAIRLAAYELAVNSLEHGRPREGRAAPSRLWMRIEACDGAVEVTLQDECESFDPTQTDRPDLEDQARGRSARGYGINMVRALVEDLQHENTDSGNRIRFRKGF